MRLKDILVHLDANAQGQARLELAAELARRHAAHLTGLFIVDVALPVMATAEASGAALLADLVDGLRQDSLAQAAQARETFDALLRREGMAGTWRLAEGTAPTLLALHARYADLAVVGQTDPDGDQPAGRALIEAVLFESGRPVLVVPQAGRFGSLGRRVLVGWNASREAARAVNDALPLLAGAERVTVLAVNPRQGIGGHGEEPGADIALHLARHGIRVAVEHCVAPEISDGDMLLNRAAESSADLLVIGAYGHSRLREMVLGGVTRTLLQQMTLPVLLAH